MSEKSAFVVQCTGRVSFSVSEVAFLVCNYYLQEGWGGEGHINLKVV